MNTFMSIIFNPIRVFNGLKNSTNFSATTFMVLLFLMLINLILNIPVNERVLMETFLGLNMPDEQLDIALAIGYKTRYLQVIGVEVLYFSMLLFYSLLLCVFAKISGAKLPYKKALQLLLLAYLVIAIGDFVNTGLIYMRGLGSIKGPYDISCIGLNNITSISEVGLAWYTVFAYINIFQLWFVCLISLGLKIVTDIKYIKAITISILLEFAIILIPTLIVYFSDVSKNSIV